MCDGPWRDAGLWVEAGYYEAGDVITHSTLLFLRALWPPADGVVHAAGVLYRWLRAVHCRVVFRFPALSALACRYGKFNTLRENREAERAGCVPTR